MATRDCWTRSVESPTGIHVRVYEPTPGGVLHIAIRGPGLEPLRQSLRHRDKDRAEAQARAELLRLERRVAPAKPEPRFGSLTLRELFARYPREARHRLDGSLKTEAYLRHGELVGELLMRHFGEDFEVRRLTRNRMLEFIVRRRSGELTDRRRPAGINTCHRDIGILKAGLMWACQQVDEDEPLLERNPLQGMQFPGSRIPGARWWMTRRSRGCWRSRPTSTTSCL